MTPADQKPSDDPLDAMLARLEPPDVEPQSADRIRRQARIALANEKPTKSIYFRFIEPLFVTATCAAHLYWTFSAILNILR